jgi:hypothetical protein
MHPYTIGPAGATTGRGVISNKIPSTISAQNMQIPLLPMTYWRGIAQIKCNFKKHCMFE